MTTAPDSLSVKAATGARWTALSAFVGALIQLVQLALLGRLVAPADFGLMAMMMVVVGIASTVADLGASNYLVRTGDLDRRQFQRILLLSLATSIASALLIAACAGSIARYFNAPEIGRLLPILGVSIVAGAIGQLAAALLQRMLLFRALAMTDLISSIIGLLVGGAVAWFGGGVWALIAAQLSSVSGRAVLLLVRTRAWSPPLHEGSKGLGDLLSFGGLQVGERILNFASWNVDKLIVGRMIGDAGLGIYSVSYQLVLRPFSLLSPIFARVSYPLFVSIQDDSQRLARGYLKTVQAVALFSFPVYLVVIVASDLLVRILLGPQWLQAGAVLQILAVAGLFFTVGNPIGSLLLAKNRADIGFWVNLLSLAVYAVGVYIGSHFGVIGVAWAVVCCAALVMWPVDFWVRWRLVAMRPRSYLRAVAPSTAAFVSSLILIQVLRSLPLLDGRGAAFEAVDASLAVTAFFGVMWWLDKALLIETFRLVRAR